MNILEKYGIFDLKNNENGLNLLLLGLFQNGFGNLW